jgi:hypothetical protein
MQSSARLFSLIIYIAGCKRSSSQRGQYVVCLEILGKEGEVASKF